MIDPLKFEEVLSETVALLNDRQPNWEDALAALMYEEAQRAKEEKRDPYPISDKHPELPVRYDFEHCPTKVDPVGPYGLMDTIAAIILSRGVLGEVAALLGRRRQRVKDYIYSEPELLILLTDLRETDLDRIERSHMDAALRGDGSAQRFILNSLAKDRGYAIKSEGVFGLGLAPGAKGEINFNIVGVEPDRSILEGNDNTFAPADNSDTV